MSQQLFVDSLQDKSVQPLASAFVVPHPTRPNEDTFSICPLWFGGMGLVSFFGVYDGHSGSEVSRFLAASLHRYVQASGMVAPDAATALCQAFQAADNAATLNCPDAGSTAAIALLSTANIIVAHCGDSRALLCRSGRVVALTEDHRPARPDERERILGSGGQILWNEGERVMGVLATTRAFGDNDLKQFGVTAEPEVTIVSRSPEDDELLILATDGVFNVLSNEEVADVARRVMKRALERGAARASAIRMAASAIGRFSRDRNSKDDITVLVIDLAPPGGPCPPGALQGAAAVEALSLSLPNGVAAAAAATHHQLYGNGGGGGLHQPCGSVGGQHQQDRQRQQPGGVCSLQGASFDPASVLTSSSSSSLSSSSSSSLSSSFAVPLSPDGQTHPEQSAARAQAVPGCGARGCSSSCCGRQAAAAAAVPVPQPPGCPGQHLIKADANIAATPAAAAGPCGLRLATNASECWGPASPGACGAQLARCVHRSCLTTMPT